MSTAHQREDNIAGVNNTGIGCDILCAYMVKTTPEPRATSTAVIPR